MKNNVLLEVKNLKTYFYTRWGVTKAVDGVSFTLEKGKTLGLVGESGCGKSITCLSILRLVPQPAGRIIGGEVWLEGQNLLRKSDQDMRKIRGEKVSMILQDPMTSLNPVFTIGNQICEAIKIHQGLRGRRLWEKAVLMLKQVRVPAPEARLKNYPHEFSGGMKQRVVGAIAISCEPQLLIADEPTTSLDATIQAQYLLLLREIQRDRGLAMIFVTHDFGIVARMCDHVAVMYAGKIVEIADVYELFDHPTHPYTEALMHSVPKVEERVERLYNIEGQPPALFRLPPGCSFRPRCPSVDRNCRDEYPTMVEVGKGHFVACWKFN